MRDNEADVCECKQCVERRTTKRLVDMDPDYVAVAKDISEFTDDDINAFVAPFFNVPIERARATIKAQGNLTREVFAEGWRAFLNRIGIAITRDEIIQPD